MIFDDKNPFEFLRKPGLEDSAPICDGFETIEVCNDRHEIVKILVADAGEGRYAFGYDIYFASGRHVCLLPSLKSGYCTSRREAILFMSGYIKQYSSMFSDAAIAEVEKLISQYITPSLF